MTGVQFAEERLNASSWRQNKDLSKILRDRLEGV